MDAHILDWSHLLVRWFHIIVGISWIGASFYFVWLDNSLREPEGTTDPRVGGEVWSIHGGGFYRVEKFTVAPATLPKTLHWFKWDAYLTLLSGLALLTLVYYIRADAYLLILLLRT